MQPAGLRRRGSDRPVPSRAHVSRPARRRRQGAAGAVQDRALPPSGLRLRGGQRRPRSTPSRTPSRLPRRLEPTERIETTQLRPAIAVPGHGYHAVSWLFAPNLFRGLLRFDRGFEVVPDLAEQVSVSPDGRVFRFLLRPGTRWSDSEPLTAEDFAFTYRTMQEQSVGTASLLGGVERRPWTSRTLQLRFEEPRLVHPLPARRRCPYLPRPRHQVEASRLRLQRAGRCSSGTAPSPSSEADDDLTSASPPSPEWAGSAGERRPGRDLLPVSPSTSVETGVRDVRLPDVLRPAFPLDGRYRIRSTRLCPRARHASLSSRSTTAPSPRRPQRVRLALAHSLLSSPFR